ncbi:MAG: carbohydrate porin [Burkholderiales bacterium]|nr:carbohydrate porin [Phycisphaerae bacterium]
MLSTAAFTGAQDAAEDFDFEALAAVEMGFDGLGEPSPPNQPYEPVSEAPIAPAPDDWYGQWQKWKAGVKDRWGTSFDFYFNPSDHYIVAGPNDGINRGALWFNFHLEQKLWQGARIVSNTRGGSGHGLGRYMDSRFKAVTHSNEATGLYVSHLFLEQKLFNDKVTLAAGKMDLLDSFDTNEVGSWNFVPYPLARNPAIPAPYHSLAATVKWDVAEWFYAEAGISDSDGDVTETGFNTAFRSDEAYFSIYEIGIKPKLLGRPGTYRFIYWNDTGDLGRYDGGGVESSDSGYALSFDQKITDHLGLFARYGYADAAVHQIEHFWSFGGTYSEPIPGRKKDTLGFGVAQGLLSDDFRATKSATSATTTLFNLYYKIQVQQWVSVTPDFQLILNPNNDADDDLGFIVGLHVEMRF